MSSTPSNAKTGLNTVVEQALQDRGVNLLQYKVNFLMRRLDVRLRARGLSNYTEYASLLEKNPSEYPVLFNTLSIGVTEFFRDDDVFFAFSSRIVSELLASPDGAKEIHVWSAGCSTGEEVYTIAILLNEALRRAKVDIVFRVIGTDISQEAIACSRRGIYPHNILKKMPESIFTRYFQSSSKDGRYQVCQEIRDTVSFETGDITRIAPPKDLDAIFCRNLLMYYERKTQHELLSKFYDSLRPSRYLILGKAEVIIGEPSHFFEVIMPSERIYKKRDMDQENGVRQASR